MWWCGVQRPTFLVHAQDELPSGRCTQLVAQRGVVWQDRELLGDLFVGEGLGVDVREGGGSEGGAFGG
jgi:hypothetical protein